VFVIFSVTLLSLAAGAGLLAQLGLAVWWAMVGSLAIYAALLSLHGGTPLVRRHARR
jgi:hypothetical protein